MQRKIRFNLKIDTNNYIYSIEELNNIDMDLFIDLFDSEVLSNWLEVNNYSEFNEIKKLKDKLENKNTENKDQYKITELTKIFNLDKFQIDKYLKNTKTNYTNKTEKDFSIEQKFINDEYRKYSNLKKYFEEHFKFEKDKGIISTTIKTSYLKPKKEVFDKLKELNNILHFWNEIDPVKKDFENWFKEIELQPILYYLMILDEFNYLKVLSISKFKDKFYSNLNEVDSRNEKFITFYSNIFKEISEITPKGKESNAIVIKNDNFDIESKRELQSYSNIDFKLKDNSKSKKATLTLLMLDKIKEDF